MPEGAEEPRSFCFGLTTRLVQAVKSEYADQEVLSYALEVLALNTAGLVLTVGLAVWLGVLGPALVVLGTGVVLRKVLGGAHLGGPVRCLIFSALVVVSLGELSLIMARSFDTAALLVAAAGAGCFLFIASHLWAPADTAAKPILSPVY
ncbi:MAG: accessory gene regulator B family protein, partial [Clostridia bacterium]|nr:accessory gene regulator B family protein [Clostridia bacterium]